ncbi:MAG: alpha-amylase family glycosyl hydrolase [Spirochaetota bacterium]
MGVVEPWWHRAAFYHIYPLGYCAAPEANDGAGPAVSRIEAITRDLDRIVSLGFNALYLGPLFESGSHGYDTRDFFRLDRRLGDDEDFASLVAAAHERGVAVVVDGVYNHVGRGFEPFVRLREEGPDSPYRSWFRGVDFAADNRFGDRFVYEGWEGVEELVALNHDNPEVREYLLRAAEYALERYGVDGIRLDVAYSLPFEFIEALSDRVGNLRADAWLMGEVIHGDYAAFVAPGRLDSITNYECYKGLWSSFNDRNLHEIAHSLDRLFGADGLLADALARGNVPYNFADNHDVDRVASRLATEDHLFPLYAILWTMPGIPSVYYGSEYGIRGRKDHGDSALRPAAGQIRPERPELARYLRELNEARASSAALRTGAFRLLGVDSATLMFVRTSPDGSTSAGGETVLVAVNADPEPTQLVVPPEARGRYECLFGGGLVTVETGSALLDVPARGARVLRRVEGS